MAGVYARSIGVSSDNNCKQNLAKAFSLCVIMVVKLTTVKPLDYENLGQTEFAQSG